MVGNNKEYHAMMREMDTLEQQNRPREEEKSAVSEELSRQLESRRALDERMAALQAELDTAKAGLESRLSAARARLTELAGLRGEAGQAVPEPILKRYEFIRSRLKNPVIVPVTTGICSGCHISIPPQSFIELQKGVQILSCPNCQRLIYWSNHVAPEEPAEAGEKVPAEAQEA
jgi:predicted  nucleic acid-binding Zn-ribbon protein